jgi:hypothetical protein
VLIVYLATDFGAPSLVQFKAPCLENRVGRFTAVVHHTSAHLQPLALNAYVRRRSDNAFCRTDFGNRPTVQAQLMWPFLSKVQAPPPRFQISIRQWSLLAGIAKTNVTAAAIITPHNTPVRNSALILLERLLICWRSRTPLISYSVNCTAKFSEMGGKARDLVRGNW